jgi:BirA family biotin operon repressor/biotin-[acetyl-CoA-carboxylase] ligase
VADFLAHRERFAVVGSTNDVVRGWLADGTPEVCLAVADEQTAGRGREGRTWRAPAGAALLLSLGFRPDWIAAAQVWRLAATVSLAMADAAEATAGLPNGAIRLKWPNDLVIESDGVRKLAGVLGETDGLGGLAPRAVIGLGLNTNWPRDDFPPDLAGTMTSLREASVSPIDHEGLLDGFLGRLEMRIEALRDGRFDETGWAERQLTTGRDVELIAPDGAVTTVRALNVDEVTGALIVADPHAPNGERHLVVGEIRHVRLPLSGSAATGPTAAPAGAGV